MPAKVYVLLDSVLLDSAGLVDILRHMTGVTLVDTLDGSPDLLMVIEAPERLKAAEYLTDILDSVDGMIESVYAFPVQIDMDESYQRKNRLKEVANHV